MHDEVADLSGEFDWDWAESPIRPAIRTKAGQRDYTLSSDFGFNFARGGDQSSELRRKLGITLSPVSFRDLSDGLLLQYMGNSVQLP